MAASCSRCGAGPVVYARPLEIDVAHRRYSAQNLCAACFCAWVNSQFRRAIESDQLIRGGDRILVAMSGGKDSQLLVSLLAKYREQVSFEWLAITVDEGIAGYRPIGLELARATAQKLGLDHISLSYAEVYGLTLDEIVNRSEETGALECVRKRVCALCGVPRMNLVLEAAVWRECNVIAMGRNLDDFVSDTLLYMCTPQGPSRLNAFRPKLAHYHNNVRTINPLWKLTDKEIALCCRLSGVPYQLEPECPYSECMLADVMRGQVYGIEEVVPGFRHAFAAGVQRLQPYLTGPLNKRSPLVCPSCHRPYNSELTGDICPECEFQGLIEKLGGHARSLSQLAAGCEPVA